jgi:hypothetical protein
LRAWLGAGRDAVLGAGAGSLRIALVIASAVALAMMAGLAVYLAGERK